MKLKILNDTDAVANEAARVIASLARQAVSDRGQFVMAVSGGKTPWLMLKALGHEIIPWEFVHIFQVDERAAPPGHQDRNLTHLRESLLEHTPLSEDHIHAMPVNSYDLEDAAIGYSKTLCQIAGSPPILDLVHLGLGVDGHTASLVPKDRVLEINDREVAITDIYQGRQRMTLTYPIINRSRNIMWVITGSEKVSMLKNLLAADPSIPAGRIGQDKAFVLADRDASGYEV